MKVEMIKYNCVDSTNNVAIRRIKQGKTKPTLIIANSQKKGKSASHHLCRSHVEHPAEVSSRNGCEALFQIYENSKKIKNTFFPTNT